MSSEPFTVVYRGLTNEERAAIAADPKAVWFGWCHAPYERDNARAAVEAALRDAPQAEGWKLVPASPTMEVRKHLEGKVGVDFLLAYADWCRPSAPTAVEPDERAMFEAWVIENPYIAAKDSWDERSHYGAKEYENHEVQLMWEAWQAARASKGTK